MITHGPGTTILKCLYCNGENNYIHNNSVAKNVNLTGKIVICNHNQREVKIIIFCHKIGFHNYACLSLQKSIQNEL